jgi:hypothetical protein
VVVLTDRGRDLLNSHRIDRDSEQRQEFYAGLVKPREVEHDAQVYQAYLREADKLAERDAHIDRVVLDYELKREYQRWLHERDADRDDAARSGFSAYRGGSARIGGACGGGSRGGGRLGGFAEELLD